MTSERFRGAMERYVTGDAHFAGDDLAERADVLEVWPVVASGGTGLITMRNPWPARRLDGVSAVVLAGDIPGENVMGAGSLFAENEIEFSGQLVGAVVAESRDLARRAAAKVEIEVQSNPGLLTIEEAVLVESYHGREMRIGQGDVGRAMHAAPRSVAGTIECGEEGDRNLEPTVAWALLEEGGRVRVGVATAAPVSVQKAVAKVLGVSVGRVVVEVPRVGGMAEGGNAGMWASVVALAALQTGRPVRLCPAREVELRSGARRHPLRAEYEAGHDAEGRLKAVRVKFSVNGGYAMADPEGYLTPMLLQVDHAYYVADVEYSARVYKTNLAPGGVYRGRGVAFGAVIMEEIVSRVAEACQRKPEEIRELNFYRGKGEGNTTPYGQEVRDNELGRLWNRLMDQSQFAQRRALVDQWNGENRFVKRGLAMTPVKVGLGSLKAEENQAAAMVQLGEDGGALVFLGDVDAGQGLHEKVRLIVAAELGIAPGAVEMGRLRSDQMGGVPSDGGAGVAVDLNGRAVREACAGLRERLGPVAKSCLDAKGAVTTGEVVDILFEGGRVFFAGRESGGVSLGEVVARAMRERVSLTALGHAKAAGVYFDFEAGRGEPFGEFVVGAAAAEVELDLYTGETRVLRADLLQEAGTPLHPAIDLALLEGGFVQGQGWLTKGGIADDEGGEAPGVESWVTINEVPMDFRAQFWMEGRKEDRIAKGEAAVDAPFVLALCVREAIRDALITVPGVGGEEGVAVPFPATPEAILEMLPDEAGAVEDKTGAKEGKKGGKKAKSAAKKEVAASDG
jgi:xanthine dehydrogenase large subunit